MLATRTLKQDEAIISEQPVFVLKDEHNDEGKRRFLKAFRQLGEIERHELLSLYDPGEENISFKNIEGDDDADRALRIVYSNGIDVSQSHEQVTAVYPTLCRINHSCQANTYQRFSGENWTITFVASREIPKGAEVTFNYLGASSVLLTREERRARLGKSWFFECSCQLCALDWRLEGWRAGGLRGRSSI